jgi:F420-non-reducing hydrogenase iron-sulfur subunit
MQKFEPKIIAFVCNWCTYAGADLAGTSRLKYAPNVRLVRFPCTGRIDYQLILKAFENGADGVIVSGCHPNDCHYTSGNFYARRRWMLFKSLMEFIGFDMNRVYFSWISAAEGAKFAAFMNEVTESIRNLGPLDYYRELASKGIGAIQEVKYE